MTKIQLIDEAATPDPSLSFGTKAGPKPNIKFIGRHKYADRKQRVLEKRADPVERFQFDGRSIQLPPAAEQVSRRLFFHEDAAIIRQHFPHLYKRVR